MTFTLNESVREAIRMHRANGLSRSATAKTMGISFNSVQGQLRRMKIDQDVKSEWTGAVRYTAVEDAVVIEKMREGLVPRDIAPHVPGRSVDSIYRRSTYLARSLPPVPVAPVTLDEEEVPRYGLVSLPTLPSLREPVAVVFVAPKAAKAATVFDITAKRCCWLDGESLKEYRQCTGVSLIGDDVPKPHSYCAKHRSVAYRPVADKAAA